MAAPTLEMNDRDRDLMYHKLIREAEKAAYSKALTDVRMLVSQAIDNYLSKRLHVPTERSGVGVVL